MNFLKAAAFSHRVMSQLRFDGRVVLITGAGRGLGKAYALEFANRGAKVVVNDLGNAKDGSGKRVNDAADEVVKEIESKGGVAVANYDSVEEGEKVVQSAIDKFGRIDVVINNAGILNDVSFAKMKDSDWSLVQKVHLFGAYKVTKAAWPHLTKQKFGRIIMTTSASGLYGNYGQANYSAAKMGLVGFKNTLAIEGAKHNVFCNAIAPIAASRLTDKIMPKELKDDLKPEFVAPFVVNLCHESSTENGALIEVAAGWASRVRFQGTAGTQFKKWGNPVTAEVIRDHWEELSNWDDAVCRTSPMESTIVSRRELPAESQASSKSSGPSLDPAKMIGFTFPQAGYSYSAKDAILYALGVGATMKTDSNSELKFLYENHEEFSVLPTFGVILAQGTTFDGISGGIPGAENLDFTHILHGEHYLELHRPLPTGGDVKTTARVTDVVDKGKGALLLLDADTKDAEGNLICTNQFSIFINKAGGFGGRTKAPAAKPLGVTPTRSPDKVVENKTTSHQAALYRLNGDKNPLHIDPNFAAMAGFKTPILHGLCAYGFAARNVLESFAEGDVKKFKCMKARFQRPVIPGQTLVTEMWKEGCRVHFQVTVDETSDKVLTGGYIDLHGEKGVSSEEAKSPELNCAAVFHEISSRVKDLPDISKSINGVFVWRIKKDGKEAGSWVMDFKSSPAKVYKGSYDGKPDVQVIVSDDDYVALATGQLNPQQAFMDGKLKISGNIMLTQKLGQIFNSQKAKL